MISKAESKAAQAPKGAHAEELLRNYFLSIGYFVTRGNKFIFNGFDVTDVDLWLYARNSPLSRERVCVDIKNKKTPQALERIFWGKGLKDVLALDRCIVATTDSRPDVREFGLRNDVHVIDGKFLARLTKSLRTRVERLSEEEFVSKLDEESLGRLGGGWKDRYEESKSRLLQALNFDGCNAWLEDINYALEQIASGNRGRRLFYAFCAHFAIAVDFILKDIVTEDHDQRRQILGRGFRYGVSGEAFTEKVGRIAAALVESVATQPGLAETLQHELRRQASNVRAEILSEFLAKNSGAALFEVALTFEAAAFSPLDVKPTELPPAAQAVIGVLSDFSDVDRKTVLA